MNSTMIFTIPFIVVVLFLIWLIFLYNDLIMTKNQVKNAWSQIDVQLKRRCDLIPNLVEAVKGYAMHEKEVLENVIKARQQAINVTGSNIKNRAIAENTLSDALKSLFAVAENYPDLKANQNFLQFQEELVSTENKISYARQAYNDAVLEYNNKKEVFPSNIVANFFNFLKFDYFQISQNEKDVPKVKF